MSSALRKEGKKEESKTRKGGRRKKEREQLGESQVCVCGKCEKTRAPRGHTDTEERSMQMVPLSTTVSYLDSPGKELYK